MTTITTLLERSRARITDNFCCIYNKVSCTSCRNYGKSSKEQRQHMASRCIQQRARRTRINKSTILNFTLQNLRSFSMTNNKTREKSFHKFSKQQHDVGLLQETHNHKSTGHENIVNWDNELLLSHSAAKKAAVLALFLTAAPARPGLQQERWHHTTKSTE